MRSLDEAIERAVAILSGEPRVRVAYLFGSAARPGSVPPRDLDLAVCAGPPLDHPELLRLQGRLQEAIRLPVDLVSLDDAPIVLAHEIIEGGRCLYARSPDDETEVVTRTRIRWWDWLPVRERQWQASGDTRSARRSPSGCAGRGSPSPARLGEARTREVSQLVAIVHLSSGGWLYGVTQGLPHANVRRQEQVRTADDPARCLQVTRTAISAALMPRPN